MASNTDNFKLILPEKGEFTNNWHEPVNDNFEVIDLNLGNVTSEVQDARGSAASLGDRLDESLNPDGSVKPVPDITKASSSQVYGRDLLGTDFDLDQRILSNDFETFNARQGDSSLKDSMARYGNDWVHNSVVEGANGFLTFTGATVKVDGSVDIVIANINGKQGRVRKLISSLITGSIGTKHVRLKHEADGIVVVDSTLPSITFGTTLQEPATTGPIIKFKDAGRNFAGLDIKPGDILKITTTGDNKGTYVVEGTFNEFPSIATDELLIKGSFQSITSNLEYTISDPFAVSLDITDTDPGALFVEEAGFVYVGKAEWDGGAITSLVEYQKKGKFLETQAVALVAGNFENVFNHDLGWIPKSIQIYASASNDFTSPLIPLGIASGPSGLERNVIVEATRDQIRVKNASNGLFYKDYDGVSNTTGFLIVIAER